MPNAETQNSTPTDSIPARHGLTEACTLIDRPPLCHVVRCSWSASCKTPAAGLMRWTTPHKGRLGPNAQHPLPHEETTGCLHTGLGHGLGKVSTAHNFPL